MSHTSHYHLFTSSPSRISLSSYLTTTLNNPTLSPPLPPILSRYLTTALNSQNIHCNAQNSLNFPVKPYNFPLKAYQSRNNRSQAQIQSTNTLDLDAFLSIAELLCILSSAIITVSYAVNFSAKRPVLGVIGSNKVFAWGVALMASGVAIGAWIRRRQWRRICLETVRMGGGVGESVNLVERIERLEEDLKSSATIVRVLSRQLEKLGIRFRVTRKALKAPIAETAALAQKNSEATRALAVQEDILEKELGEIQKVLLAMQEQQQKQLELILAIGKTGKLFESRREPSQEQDMIAASDLTEGVKQLEAHETQASSVSKGTNNDRA